MAYLTLLLVSSALVLSQPSDQVSKSQQPDQTASTQLPVAANQQSTAPGLEGTIALSLVTIAWLTLVIQTFVLPFYNKGETLHKDYWGSGKINSTLAAIEAGRLIPSLAKMFILAASHQTDKRRRPESEIEELLQSVEFTPDLKVAQDAMSQMDAIRKEYMCVKQLASRLWKIGLFHVVASLCLPVIYIFAIPTHVMFQWLLLIFAVAWILSVPLIVWGFFRFHSHIERFNALLEFEVAEDT